MFPVVALSQASPLTPNPAKSESIPAQFQGMWDANLKACEAVASDMRYYIGPHRMRFGDAVGTVRRVTVGKNQSISVLTAFRSDGDPWEGEVRLTLSPTEDELTVQTGQSSTSRHRCPVAG
jgi:hypothetical protein